MSHPHAHQRAAAPRRRRLRPLALGAAALLLAPALAACGGGATASDGDTATLRVGQLGSAEVTEALLAASGEDEGLDYEIEYSLFPSGGGGFFEAVPSGSVDVAQMADTPPIFGQVAGVEAKVVGVQTSIVPDESTVEIFATDDSGITSAADLEGKRVALTEGTIMQYTVVRALEEVGLDYSDIVPVNLPPADAVTAFQGGDVDAIAALTVQLAQLRTAGARSVADGVGTTSGYQFSVVDARVLEDDDRLAQVTDFLQRVGRAQEWAAANTEEWIPAYAEVLGVPEDVARILVEREDHAWVPIDDEVIAAQQAQADAYTELGLIAEPLDVTEQFDDRISEQLVAGE